MKATKEALGAELRGVEAVKNLFPMEEGEIVIKCNEQQQINKITTIKERSENIEIKER